MTQAFDQAPLDPVRRAERDLAARLDELRGDGLKLPITPGPVFVLLALATGDADFDVTPDVSIREVAAQKLLSASPGGYYIDKRAPRRSAPCTFGSIDPNPNVTGNRFAYVHISGEGMVEMASGEVADASSRALVGLGSIERSIHERDAMAMQAAFEALQDTGPIVVTVALLRTLGVEVRWDSIVPGGRGVLRVPFVKVESHCFPDRSELHARNLNQRVNALWDAAVQQARSQAQASGARTGA